ncbi:MAG: Ig-like domain-containing protein [Candidatus Azobacteroides sp.]|nr:Ig-like domain-containing protein [Candidatus Azobacteroides sp.]
MKTQRQLKKMFLSFLCVLLGISALYAADPIAEQKIYIDFGMENYQVSGADENSNYWNNVTDRFVSAEGVELVNSGNINTNFVLQVIKKFSSNSVGPSDPDPSLLGDFAISNATRDFFFVEGSNTYLAGAVKIKNLDPNKSYRFHVFGSRADNQDRIALFTFSGLNVDQGTNQGSGVDIGGPGINYNNSSILVSDYIFPTPDGEIVVELTRAAGSYAYLNAMKIEEFSGMAKPDYVLQQKFYFDFGGDNRLTVGPDKNNNYWNNITSITQGTSFNLVSAVNATSGYSMEVTENSQFSINLTEGNDSPGGLENPDEELLGDLALETATRDYFYVESTETRKGELKLKGLDTNKAYKFFIFGSRSGSDVRIARYVLTGLNTAEGYLQSTGSDIGIVKGGNARSTQNESAFFISDMVVPDANGEIILEVLRPDNGNGIVHLNMMKMEEYSLPDESKASSLTISGEDITVTAQTSQMTATVLPATAIYPAIQWSVDNEDIAWIDTNGLLHPKKNGTVTVTASIQYEGEAPLTSTQQVTINNQVTELYFVGSASESGDGLENAISMKMLTDLNGSVGAEFEIFTKLTPEGTFKFYTSREAANAIVYGGSNGNLIQDGSDISVAETQPVRILVNMAKNTFTVFPVSLSLVGSAVPGGWEPAAGIEVPYLSDGIWSGEVTLNAGSDSDPARVVIALDKSWDYLLKKVKESENVLMMESVAEANGIVIEDIDTNLNGGTFEVTIDLRNYTFSIECLEVNDYKISMMGSSVANGQGADNMQGYAYMFGQLLNERYQNSKSEYNWEISGISINGNNTQNLLDRWYRDLMGDCSRYVIYGLSLGNEGIHENGQSSFDSYHDNMLTLIDMAKQNGKIPVMSNSYTRGDFNTTDYAYVKSMNLLVHEWDIPSINLLGAIDNGAGKWADGYQVEGDIYHPTTEGHREFFYAMVPSLFDALESGKPQPQRDNTASYNLGKDYSQKRIELIPEHTVHPFTLSFGVKTSGTGKIASFESTAGTGYITVNESGQVIYESPIDGTIESTTAVNDNSWYQVSLSHYYAQGRTLLFVNNVFIGELAENLVPQKFYISDKDAPENIHYRELFFYRSAMNEEEINALYNGRMLKSSLEIYAPLSELGDAEDAALVNLAQSMNTIKLVASDPSTILENPEMKNEISLFPNPVSTIINLQGLKENGTYECKVFSLDGKMISTSVISAGQTRINVSSLPAAYYIVVVKDTETQEEVNLNFIKINK